MKKKSIHQKNYKNKISVIIPTYNEQNTIKEILKKVKSIKLKKEIIVINDGSNDNTSKILKSLKNKYINILLNLKKNKGKGYAIRQGLKKASGEIIIIQDADLEYDPKDIVSLLHEIESKKCQVVYGSRVLSNPGNIKSQNFSHNLRILGNIFLTKLSNILNNQNLTDAHTCYKLFKSDLFKSIKLEESDFSFCPEITTKISLLNIDIFEIPINYNGRTYDQGKKIVASDGLKAIWTLMKYRFF